jgi:hypothetical protein
MSDGRGAYKPGSSDGRGRAGPQHPVLRTAGRQAGPARPPRAVAHGSASPRIGVSCNDGAVTGGENTQRMGTIEEERTGVLVLRAWVETDEEPGLRVRIIRLVQGDAAEPLSAASATVDGVCAIVRCWLEELLYGLEATPPRAER